MLQSVIFPLAPVGLPVLLLSSGRMLNPLRVRVSKDISPRPDADGSTTETGVTFGEVGGLLKESSYGAAVNGRLEGLLTLQNLPVLVASVPPSLPFGCTCRIIGWPVPDMFAPSSKSTTFWDFLRFSSKRSDLKEDMSIL